MKFILILWLISFTPTFLKSQDVNEFGFVDQKALSIPLAETFSTTSIAKFITANFESDREKIRAVYTWVTANIKYDKDSIHSINTDKEPGKRITEALRRRKGVCENYAAVFNDIAIRCGINSFVVNGYTKQLGVVNKEGHSWCAVNIDAGWLLCDPTWDEGFKRNTEYFLVQPQTFIESHMPFDPLWQLLDHPISQDQFFHGTVDFKKDKIIHKINDSIMAFMRLNELQKLESAATRMKLAGMTNDLAKIYFRYLEMQIGIIYEDQDMNLYNTAVNELNSANNIFNDFVEYRNNRFLPVTKDSLLVRLLDPAEDLLDSALLKIARIGQTIPNYQYDPEILKNRIFSLKKRIADQQVFLKTYIDSAIPEREKLFYK